MEETRPSLAKRALAILVLAIAGWILLKLVIGLIAGLATFIIIVVAIVAIIWALNTLHLTPCAMVYVVIALSFALAGGIVGKLKGSSFFLWFLISGLFPFIGLAAAVLYRYDTEEPRRACPQCGRICMLHDALCTRCGCELEWPDEVDAVPPAARA